MAQIPGRTLRVSTSGVPPELRTMVDDINNALRELDQRKPILAPQPIVDNSNRPVAEISEGQVIFANGQLQYSDGGEWIIISGGTSTPVAFDNIAPTTTKGDLIVHNGSVNTREAVGTNNYVLTADSAQSTGIKWADNVASDVALYTRMFVPTTTTVTVPTKHQIVACEEYIIEGDGNLTLEGTAALCVLGPNAEVDMTDFFVEVQKGNIGGHKMVHKFGRNPDVDTGTVPEDVWLTGGLMTWPTSAAVVSVTSTDADDDGNPTTNTGAHTLTIEGLDASFDELTETITLNGVGAVTTSASFIRINRAFVATAGTYHGTNEGSIIGTVGGATMFTILVGLGQTQVARYTVPNAKTAYLTYIVASTDEKKSGGTIQLFHNHSADDTSQPFAGSKRLIMQLDNILGEETIQPRSGIKFDGKTDIWFEIPAVGADNTEMDVDFELLVVDD